MYIYVVRLWRICHVSIFPCSKKPFNAVYRQYVDIAETTAEMIRAYHVTSLWSCVLHDADSNDWSNDKDFYEDERCSFVVQMFNLHMKSLRHDLWSCCPAKQARNIYVHVLKEGVAYLAQRYAHVTPSYRRTKQVKFDVTTLLMCVSELLLPCCGHVGHYLDASSHDDDIWSIHNSCCTLVAAMAVICAPVDVLYKYVLRRCVYFNVIFLAMFFFNAALTYLYQVFCIIAGPCAGKSNR